MMSANQDAKSFLTRYPWGITDADDPRKIIEDLLRENELLRGGDRQLIEARERANKAEAKVKLLLQELSDMAHSKASMTRKRLRDVMRDLEALK